MKYNILTTPCADCPFLARMSHAFTLRHLTELADGTFHCHKTGDCDEETGDFVAKPDGSSLACAGALIFLEKRGRTSNIMRIMERLGAYDHRKLDMNADVR